MTIWQLLPVLVFAVLVGWRVLLALVDFDAADADGLDIDGND